MLRHQFCATTQDDPGQKRTDDGVADADPSTRQTILPTKLSGVAHEDHRREIRGSESEGREPGPYGATTQYETVDCAGLLTGVYSHTNHHGQKDESQNNLYNHNLRMLLVLGPEASYNRWMKYSRHRGSVCIAAGCGTSCRTSTADRASSSSDPSRRHRYCG